MKNYREPCLCVEFWVYRKGKLGATGWDFGLCDGMQVWAGPKIPINTRLVLVLSK